MKILTNCTLFDGHHDQLTEGAWIFIEGERIRELGSGRCPVSDATVIDLGGRFVMPGLIDLHFHAYSITMDMRALDSMCESLKVAHAGGLLRGALHRGYTSVRDPAGGDIGLQLAVDQGLFPGPRYFHGGKALSQTGGHGDMRRAEQAESPCGCAANSTFAEIVDGVDAVRKFCRNELRKGADHIKVFISGGVASPTDPLWMPQYTDAELEAAVYEAATRRKYVVAHCHTDDGAQRCLRTGIRSIDHCTIISEGTAHDIAAADGHTYAVPTLAVLEQLVAHGPGLGVSADSMAKAREAHAAAYHSLEYLQRAGARMGMGTDLFGADFHVMQNREFEYRADIVPAIDLLRSATSVNAEIMQKKGVIGSLEAGAYADILVIDGNPLDDIRIMGCPEKYYSAVMQGGEFVRSKL